MNTFLSNLKMQAQQQPILALVVGVVVVKTASKLMNGGPTIRVDVMPPAKAAAKAAAK